jgi:uncharacterized protein YegL
MDEAKGKLLPVYFVADDSGSMKCVIGEFNEALKSLLDAMATEATASAKIRFTVLSFSGDVLTHLQLADLRYIDSMPTFSARENTCYSAAFRDLRRRMDPDINGLRGKGYQINRPTIFFLSDGAPDPDDDWRGALAELKDANWGFHPNILAFGIGDAERPVIREVASKPEWAFVNTGKGAEVGKALSEFFVALTQSLIMSGSQQQLVIKEPDGFMRVDVDVVAS